MAQIPLTDTTRVQLAADPAFQAACVAAIIDQATNFLGDNGVGKVSAQAAQLWAQGRPEASKILAAPLSYLPDQVTIANQMVLFLTIGGVPCWDSVLDTTAAAISYLTTNGFFGAGSLAQSWFTKRNSQSPWN